MKRLQPFWLLLLSLAMLSCDKNSLGTVDVGTNVPLLTNASVTPDSIYIDNLTPTGGSYAINAVVKVRMNAKGAGTVVTASVLSPFGLQQVVSSVLHDDGVAPDQTANDSVYSGTVSFSMQRAYAGKYIVQFNAATSDGFTSNTIQRRLFLNKRSTPPVITAATSPDSISLPTSGYVTVQFTATVTDSDGLAAIQQVYFTRISPPDPAGTRFYMQDDGSLNPPVLVGSISVRSGDRVAGDGIYSFLIPVTPDFPRRTNIFAFHAVDTFGDTSNVIQRTFIIQ